MKKSTQWMGVCAIATCSAAVLSGCGDPTPAANPPMNTAGASTGGGGGTGGGTTGTILTGPAAYTVLTGADAMALVTEWKPFRNPDFDAMKRLMRSPVIFDGRNQYDPRQVRALGFEYFGIGR